MYCHYYLWRPHFWFTGREKEKGVEWRGTIQKGGGSAERKRKRGRRGEGKVKHLSLKSLHVRYCLSRFINKHVTLDLSGLHPLLSLHKETYY